MKAPSSLVVALISVTALAAGSGAGEASDPVRETWNEAGPGWVAVTFSTTGGLARLFMNFDVDSAGAGTVFGLRPNGSWAGGVASVITPQGPHVHAEAGAEGARFSASDSPTFPGAALGGGINDLPGSYVGTMTLVAFAVGEVPNREMRIDLGPGSEVVWIGRGTGGFHLFGSDFDDRLGAGAGAYVAGVRASTGSFEMNVGGTFYGSFGPGHVPFYAGAGVFRETRPDGTERECPCSYFDPVGEGGAGPGLHGFTIAEAGANALSTDFPLLWGVDADLSPVFPR